MPLYFLLLDAGAFHSRIRPCLAESWRRRSFAPCRQLCADLLPTAREFAERYHIGHDEPLLTGVAQGLTFHRDFWRSLAGELLWYSAAEVPELETSPDELEVLLGGDSITEDPPRERFSPIRQAHFGTQEIAFGSAFYRPGNAGLNDAGDVARLADYLDVLRPEEWLPDRLALLGLDDPDERVEELEYLRDWFAPFRALYARARQLGQVIVCEILEGGRDS